MQHSDRPSMSRTYTLLLGLMALVMGSLLVAIAGDTRGRLAVLVVALILLVGIWLRVQLLTRRARRDRHAEPLDPVDPDPEQD